MQTGSTAQCVRDFTAESKNAGVTFPELNEILTVNTIALFHTKTINGKEIHTLTFDEYPELHPICDQTIYEKPNFIELLPPIDMAVALELPVEEAIY